MPTYEYQCDKCGGTFDVFQRMSDDPVDTCAHCGSKRVRRLIGGGAGIIFKGSGFYETDYKRGKDYKDAATRDKDSPAKTEDKKTESAAKTESKSSEAAA